MINKYYELMSRDNLWKEIELIIGCSNLSEIDKEVFKELLQIWGVKDEA